MCRLILIATPFFPYPPTFGGVYDIFGRIVELKERGYVIDLIYTEKEKPKSENIKFLSKYVNKTYFVERKNKVSDLLSMTPLQVNSRKNIKSIILSNHYDLLVIEGDYMGDILLNKSLKSDKKVLRVHNIESFYFRSLAKSSKNILRKTYYHSEGLKFKKYSRKLYSCVDRLWFISSDEYLMHKEGNHGNKGIHLPAPISLEEFNYSNKLESTNVLFVGSLFMPNNLEAIMWYLDNVHDNILKIFPRYKFIIAGNTGKVSEEPYRKLFSKYLGVEFFLNLESLNTIYSKASVFVNPMQHGAGVKIKSICAIMKGLPLIASSVGSEGIGLVDKVNFLKAETPKQFVDGIKVLLESLTIRKKISREGQLFLKKKDSSEILKNELSTLFKLKDK